MVEFNCVCVCEFWYACEKSHFSNPNFLQCILFMHESCVCACVRYRHSTAKIITMNRGRRECENYSEVIVLS